MPKDKKVKKNVLEDGTPIKKWPFIIWYTFMGELDSMEVFHYGPSVARQTFKKKYPMYTIVRTEAGKSKVPKVKTLADLPEFEIDTSIIDQIIND